jgi:hypothetical protein
MIWFVILTIVMSNGDVYSEVRLASDPTYNNEQLCNEAGKILVEEKQVEIGTTNGKAYYICNSFSSEEIDKALGRSDT